MEPDDDERIVAGAKVRFRPPQHKLAFDARLEGQIGTVIGERWGKTIRVQLDDGRVWLTFPHRVEVVEEDEWKQLKKLREQQIN